MPQMTLPDGEGMVTVIHRWDTRHGECYDCGAPAAFMDVDGMDEGFLRRLIHDYPHRKVCAVCAANRAANGETIRRIEEEV